MRNADLPNANAAAKEHLRELKPLLRLVWESLLNDAIVARYDAVAGAGCHPVLLMLDEAARFAVPSLPAYAATPIGGGWGGDLGR